VTETIFDKEKFAELIVQECIEIVEYKGRKIGTKHPVGFNLMDAAWDIKEHFGVEE
jgi:F420-0:gamma-glutamyl ligase